ncbi:hypothetical protein K9M78_00470 [Candidatus Bipolaricaulota bacterium]|nr:hypothetical protein [Candidatus Bipolaricaulota bacterium]
MEDKCGVVGVKDLSGKASLQAYYGLYALQHRGQEGAGLVSFDGFKQHTKKGLGLVGEVFQKNDLEELTGLNLTKEPNRIGHTVSSGISTSLGQIPAWKVNPSTRLYGNQKP